MQTAFKKKNTKSKMYLLREQSSDARTVQSKAATWAVEEE